MAAERGTSVGLWRMYLLIGCGGLIVIGMAASGFYLGVRMNARHAPLIDAAMEMRLEAMLARLRMEQMSAGGRAVDPKAVWKHLDQADWYARAMLEGGENPKGTFVPARDRELRRKVQAARQELAVFRGLVRRRLAQAGPPDDAGAVPPYEEAFAAFLDYADQVEGRLQRAMQEDLRRFRLIQAILVVLCVILTVSAAAAIGRHDRRRRKDLSAIQKAYADLEGQVAERERIQETLRESEDRFRGLSEASYEGIIIHDKGVAIEVNDAFCEMFGFDRSEIIGRDVIPLVVAPESQEIIRQRVASGSEEAYEAVGIRKDGSRLAAELRARPTQYRGRTVRVVAVRDITERKRAEEALAGRARQQAAVAELGRRALTGEDLSDLFEEAVRAVARTLDVEYTKVLELLPGGRSMLLRAGVGWKEGFVGRATIPAGLDSQAGYTLQSREPVVVEDLATERRFSGPPLLWEHNVVSGVSVLIGSRENPWGVLGAHTSRRRAFTQDDIHFLQAVANLLAVAIERKRVEEELARHRDRLEELVRERTAELAAANKELEAFSYSVSHDLRAPLRSIDGFSQALLEDYLDRLDERGKDYLRRVSAASRRMARLIDGVLSLSRLTRAEMRRETVDLSALARGIAADLRAAQPQRQVEIVIQEGLVGEADPRLLQVVLENLLGNAWKFTGKTPHARIEFGVTQVDGQPAYFVRDNGVGFDMAYADKLFGAFQRLHTTEEFEGDGIGLATVQRIIRRHGGRVWAEGAVGQGATFYFTLSS